MSTKTAKPTAAPDSAPAASGRLAARCAWLRGSRGHKIAAGVVLLLLLVVSPLALLASQGAFRRQEPTVERPTLATALAALDVQEFNEARRLVEEIDRQQLTPEEQGGPEFVLAVVAAQEAEELWGQERADYYLLAARHMELARERGYQLRARTARSAAVGTQLVPVRPSGREHPDSRAGAGGVSRAGHRNPQAARERLSARARRRSAQGAGAQPAIPGRPGIVAERSRDGPAGRRPVALAAGRFCRLCPGARPDPGRCFHSSGGRVAPRPDQLRQRARPRVA